MGNFVVSVVTGFFLGGTYALISLGLVLAYRATHTLNFAHGELLVFAALLVAVYQVGGAVPIALLLVLAVAAGGLVGILLFFFIIRYAIGMPALVGVAATFGVAAVMQGMLAIWVSPGMHSIQLPWLPTGRLEVLGVGVRASAVTLAIVANVIAISVALFMRYTQAGTRIRAVGQDALLASQGGINVRRVFLGSWAVAGMLAAIAGIAHGSANLFDLTAVGLMLQAAPAVVLGGLDSIEGAIVGGLAVGLIQGFSTSYLGGASVMPVTYAVLLLVLLVKPSGLFGTKTVERL